MKFNDILGGITDAPRRLERYFNFTALMQGVIAGLLLVGIFITANKKK